MNFHDLSLKLENKAREVMMYSSRPYSQIFDADSIESGRFAEVMMLLLRIKNNFMCNASIDNFIEKLVPYLNKSGSTLNINKSNDLYDEFLTVLSRL